MEQQNSKFKVFISSTFEDLKDYREAVIEQLNRMKIPEITMESFGAHSPPALDISLQLLEKCNIYIGIIGHRYGTLVPEGDKSFVQYEYKRAIELSKDNKIVLLLYLADSTVSVPISLRESDNLFEKQKQFRQFLKEKHTTALFRSPDHLAYLVSSDLFKYITTSEIPNSKSKIFNVNDDKEIEYFFNSLGYIRAERIDSIITSVAECFNCLFFIDSRTLKEQPFFKNIREKISTLMPGIIYDDKGGILERSGIRRVIFRAETTSIILKTLIKSKIDISLVGEEIGSTAARDLLKSTVEDKKLIPENSKSLIKLWNFWDSTGGWGNLSLATENESKWRLTLENNFLESNDPDENHELCYFWCGYIKGFLNYALPAISAYKGSILNNEEFNKVNIPQFKIADSVVHEMERENGYDTFNVIFKNENFANAHALIVSAERVFKEKQYFVTMNLCKSALKDIEEKSNKEEILEYNNILINLTAKEQDLLKNISQCESISTFNEIEAETWLYLIKKVIEQLT